MEPIAIYVILGVAAIIGIVIYLTIRHEKQRTQSLKQKAMQRGYSFTEKPQPIQHPFAIFQKGHSKRFRNMMKRRDITITDYRYTVGGGKNSHTYNQTIVITDTSFPDFILAPENFFHKIGKAFGMKDINFDNYPQFSKKYLLKAHESIKPHFTPEILSYLGNTKGLNIEVKDKKILYHTGKRVKPDNFNKFLDEAKKIFKLFNKEEF